MILLIFSNLKVQLIKFEGRRISIIQKDLDFFFLNRYSIIFADMRMRDFSFFSHISKHRIGNCKLVPVLQQYKFSLHFARQKNQSTAVAVSQNQLRTLFKFFYPFTFVVSGINSIVSEKSFRFPRTLYDTLM